MKSLNRVELIGNLGRDPEMRYTASGKSVANFSVATTDTWKDSSGNDQERTEWHRIVVWGKLAEICSQYLKKGSKAWFEGALQTREWEDPNGGKRTTTEIVAKNMIMLDKAPGQDNRPRNNQQPYEPPPGDDDIPF